MIIGITSSSTLFLIQILSTAMMPGIISFVQVVHYPLFAKIPTDGFISYVRSHTVRTGWVVAPLMLLEIVTAVAPFFRGPPRDDCQTPPPPSI